MGQYFLAVNATKKEYVCPWCIGGGAKLWEWAVNPSGGIFVLLLRKSDQGGGGDYDGDTFDSTPGVLVGRWAGDRVFLVGDYDSSKLFDRAHESYRNISRELVPVWNGFVEIKNYRLTYTPCDSCQEAAAKAAEKEGR